MAYFLLNIVIKLGKNNESDKEEEVDSSVVGFEFEPFEQEDEVYKVELHDD